MSIPMSDEKLIELARKWGKLDGEISDDDMEGLNDQELYDIADDAWFHSGWMNFENHPDLEDYEDELEEKSDELELWKIYKDAFVSAVKGMK